MKQPVIVSLGEALWDLFPDAEKFGGAPANFACHCAILGAEVAMVTAVGDDQRGRDAIEVLKEHKLNIGLVQVVSDAPTGSVGVQLDWAGVPTFTIHENSAWDRIGWTDELSSRVVDSSAVYFGTLGQRSETSRATIRRVVSQAKAAGVVRLLDINLRSPFFDDDLIRESVELASILKLSDGELTEVCTAFGFALDQQPETNLQRLLVASGLEMIVMTCGADGAMLATADAIVRQDAIPTEVVDTVGAGDAFAAAFLLGVLGNQPSEQNLKTACEVAAATCTHRGAVPQS